jgi:hypothetical protein
MESCIAGSEATAARPPRAGGRQNTLCGLLAAIVLTGLPANMFGWPLMARRVIAVAVFAVCVREERNASRVARGRDGRGAPGGASKSAVPFFNAY